MRLIEYPNRAVISLTTTELALLRRIVTDSRVAAVFPTNMGEHRAIDHWRRHWPIPIAGRDLKPRRQRS